MGMLPIYFTYYKILTIFSILWGFYCVFLIFRFVDLSKNLKIAILVFLFSSLVWQTAPFVLNFLSLSSALFYIKLSYFMAVLTCLSGYWVAVFFFEKYLKRSFGLELFFHILGLVCLFLAFSPFFIKGIESTQWGVSPVLGKGKFIYFTICFIFSSFSALAIKGYVASSPEDKKRGIFFIFGLILYELISGIFNVFIPLITTYPPAHYYLYGNLGPLFFIVCLLFSFFAGVFPIRTILVNLAVGIFEIFLIASIFLYSGLTKIYFIILSVVFLIIGYFLIRYTHQEVKAKEVLEQSVKERTKELERLYQDMKKEKETFEKLYNTTIGREIKMVELKKKIEELKKKNEQLEAEIKQLKMSNNSK